MEVELTIEQIRNRVNVYNQLTKAIQPILSALYMLKISSINLLMHGAA